MQWVKGIVGVVFLLIGLLWIGQGLNVLPGSQMSGQTGWAVAGLVGVVAGAWLLWSLLRARRSANVGP